MSFPKDTSLDGVDDRHLHRTQVQVRECHLPRAQVPGSAGENPQRVEPFLLNPLGDPSRSLS
jgi:hypothetical protein